MQYMLSRVRRFLAHAVIFYCEEDKGVGDFMKKDIVLMGGGGHCKVIIDAIRKAGQFSIYGIVDPILSAGETVLDVKVLGPDSIMAELSAKGIKYAFISVGSIGNCETRKKIDAALRGAGFKLPVLIHPNAIIAKDVNLGEGTFVAAGAIINPGVSIGRNAIINTAASIDHDCVIGDFVHVAPGVTLSGGVKVGNETHIGTGAKVTQYLDIGRNVLVGAGVTVRHNLSNCISFFGRRIGNRNKENRRVFIIAEAGVNHNGSIRIARKMIDAAKIERLLRDGKASEFIAVTIPEDMAIQETERLVRNLSNYGIKVKQLIVNNVLGSRDCQFCRERSDAQEKYIKQIRIKFTHLKTTIIPLQPREVKGIEALDKFSGSLFQ